MAAAIDGVRAAGRRHARDGRARRGRSRDATRTASPGARCCAVTSTGCCCRTRSRPARSSSRRSRSAARSWTADRVAGVRVERAPVRRRASRARDDCGRRPPVDAGVRAGPGAASRAAAPVGDWRVRREHRAWPAPPRDLGEMHVRAGRYIGIAPVPGGLTNVCVVKPWRPGDRAIGDPQADAARRAGARPAAARPVCRRAAGRHARRARSARGRRQRRRARRRTAAGRRRRRVHRPDDRRRPALRRARRRARRPRGARRARARLARRARAAGGQAARRVCGEVAIQPPAARAGRLAGGGRRRRRGARASRRRCCAPRSSTPEMSGTPETIALLAIVFVPMLVEARRAARNERAQRARGGVEPPGDVYARDARRVPGRVSRDDRRRAPGGTATRRPSACRWRSRVSRCFVVGQGAQVVGDRVARAVAGRFA